MENTKIQWTDATINFWTGCEKVSEGCKFCYMYRDKERYGLNGNDITKVQDKTINNTLKKLVTTSKIFTCSWSDFFIEEADKWRDWAWDIIRKHPMHQWQILTKRPERILECLPDDWGNGWDNVWLGVSVENQQRAEERIPILAKIPANIKFLSCEPLLGNIDFDCFGTELNLLDDISWLIIGGESGNEKGKWSYRPCEQEWIENITSQCEYNTVPVFIKQTGTHLAKKLKLKNRHGGIIEEFPKNLKIRQFPVY